MSDLVFVLGKDTSVVWDTVFSSNARAVSVTFASRSFKVADDEHISFSQVSYVIENDRVASVWAILSRDDDRKASAARAYDALASLGVIRKNPLDSRTAVTITGADGVPVVALLYPRDRKGLWMVEFVQPAALLDKNTNARSSDGPASGDGAGDSVVAESRLKVWGMPIPLGQSKRDFRRFLDSSSWCPEAMEAHGVQIVFGESGSVLVEGIRYDWGYRRVSSAMGTAWKSGREGENSDAQLSAFFDALRKHCRVTTRENSQRRRFVSGSVECIGAKGEMRLEWDQDAEAPWHKGIRKGTAVDFILARQQE